MVLRARADVRWRLLAVHEHLLVAFAPPVGDLLPEAHRRAHEEAPALQLGIVEIPRLVLVRRAGPDIGVGVPARAEMHRARSVPCVRTDLRHRICQAHLARTVVVYRNRARLLERHRPSALELVGARAGREPAGEGLVDGPAPEELARRYPERTLPVEGELQHGGAQIVRVVARQGECEAADGAARPARDYATARPSGSDRPVEIYNGVDRLTVAVRAARERAVRGVDRGAGAVQHGERKRLHLRTGSIGAGLDVVVERATCAGLAQVGDLAALRIGNRQIEIVPSLEERRPLRHGIGERSAGEHAPAHERHAVRLEEASSVDV